MFTDNIHTPRVIGRHQGADAGPCVIIVAAIHGNEPTGIDAAQRVLGALAEAGIPFRGDLHAFRGNLTALGQDRRYVDKDLNRIWDAAAIHALRHGGTGGELESEDHELLALWAVIEEAIGEARGDVLLVDLHTSSAASTPFIVMGKDGLLETNGWRLPVPVIIDEQGLLRGLLVNFIHSRGHAALAFEAGQHGTEQSIDIHAMAIWRFLAASGAIDREHLPPPAADSVVRAVPAVRPARRLKLTYRHAIDPRDEFAMLPGFRNFDFVQEGQLLAHDRSGEIHAPADGQLFLPLYQAVGEDGFFLVGDRQAEPSVVAARKEG